MLHQDLQERQPVHAGHFDVERQDVGIQLQDLVPGDVGIDRRADDLDPGVLPQLVGEEAADDRRIVDDEDLDLAFGGHGGVAWLGR